MAILTSRSPWPSRRQMTARLLLAVTAAASLGGLAGCASVNTVSAEVSTYGTWSANDKPGSFVIERLPSQQGRTDPDLQTIEDAVAGALQQGGFTPAPVGSTPQYLVQIGARVSRNDRAPWDDPLWWGTWGPRWSSLVWYQPGWHWGFYSAFPSRTEYLREVGILLRVRATGQAIYEARAHSDGITQGSAATLAAMARAALQGFPAVQPEPHRVSVSVSLE